MRDDKDKTFVFDVTHLQVTDVQRGQTDYFKFSACYHKKKVSQITTNQCEQLMIEL